MAGNHSTFGGDGDSGRADVRFHHLGFEEGLSQNSVCVIHQDRFGLMWFGTQDGLNRFDGNEIVVFRQNEGDLRLSDNWIWDIYEQPDGDLWIGTLNGGLNRYDPVRERMTAYMHSDNPRSISGNHVQTILGDSRSRDTLWLGTGSSGLNKLTISTGLFDSFKHDPENPQTVRSNVILALYEDLRGNMWVGSDAGLDLFDRETGIFIHHPVEGKIWDMLSLKSSPDMLWVCTRTSGLIRYNVKTGEKKVYPDGTQRPGDLKTQLITSLLEDERGQLWVGTRNGLYRYMAETDSFEWHIYDRSNPNGLAEEAVISLFQDRMGLIWAGSIIGGVSYCDPNAFEFRHFSGDANFASGPGSNNIRSFEVDREGQLWVASLETGISVFDESMASATHYRHDSEDPNSLGSDRVNCVRMGPQGDIWVGTMNGGVERFDKDLAGFVKYPFGDHPDAGDASVIVLAHDADESNHVWVGGFTNGLSRLSKDTGEYEFFRHNPSDPSSISDNMITWILDEGDQFLWVATMRGGLNRLNKETGQFTRMMHHPNKPQSINHNCVNSVYRDSFDRLWVAAANGLDLYENRGFRHFTTKDGLPNNYVYGVLEDESGVLWISTNDGLCRFDPARRSFDHYDMSNGLPTNEFNRGSFLEHPSGQLLFGCIRGFVAFRPENIGQRARQPLLSTVGFTLNNKRVTPGVDGSPIQQSLLVGGDISLTPSQRDFSFEFAVMDYLQPSANRYAWRLKPYNSQWVESSSKKRYGGYTNLDPGNYVFEVKGAGRNKVWSEVSSYKVRILPAPWQTWQARSFFALVALLIIIYFILRQNRRLDLENKRNNELERQVMERTMSLKQKNEELRNIDRTVESINSEIDLNGVLETLVKQGVQLLPQAQRGGLLVKNGEDQCFRCTATVGYDPEAVARIVLSDLEVTLLTQNAMTSLDDNLYLAQKLDPAKFPEGFKLESKSIAAMWLNLFEENDTILFLASMKECAFNESDLHTLARLRVHGLSALTKARLLKELKDKTEAILGAQQQMVIQEKMAALGSLTAGIAHEINNPSNFALGGAQSLERELERFRDFLLNLLDDDEASFGKEFESRLAPLFQYASIIKEGSTRITEIVRDLNTFSYEHKGHRAEIVLNEHIQAVVNLVGSEFKKRIQFHLEMKDALVVEVSPSEINQVILNLINNGCQAILDKIDEKGEGGTGNIWIRAFVEGREAVFQVQDDGCGMPESLKRKIFEPFFTTNKVGSGTGLGLASSYNIVKNHQGSLTVDSEEGAGSVFTLRLPLRSG